jgi:hypothetical protein
MADVVVTAANVVKSTGAITETGIAGATITAGQVVYKDATDSNKFKLADCDSATAGVRVAYGIALNGASANQTLTVQMAGDITLGAGLTAGLVYCLGDVAGAIRPSADNGAGDYTCILGIAKSASVLALSIFTANTAV